ncbi:MAG TPA: glycosyltransferase family 2 protein [Candidatus Nanoarchaeia archaeon]|nr:glycosyltransferase family 2 protein [Candidatus Nanoarchaeia archaeon]
MFSIITPTYNRGHLLLNLYHLISSQNFEKWEWIIIDDGSKDNTEEIINKLIKIDNRIKYFQQNNQGASAARNKGVVLSSKEWIVYVDSDDKIDYDFLSKIKENISKNSLVKFGIINHFRKIVLIDKNGKIISEREPFLITKEEATLKDYFHWKIKTTSTGLFHQKVLFNDNLKWDENLKLLEDWELLLQLGRVFPESFLHILEPGLTYIQTYGGDGLCSSANYNNWAIAFKYIYEKHQNDLLMAGQKWYPNRFEKYTRLQILVDEGVEPSAIYKYFPEKAS